jgi:hypothetical protein
MSHPTLLLTLGHELTHEMAKVKTKLELKLPLLAKFQVTVVGVVGPVLSIVPLTKRGQVRTALQTMLVELKKANQALIDQVLVPLMNIRDKKSFDSRFDEIRGQFKRMALGHRKTLAVINCNKVTLALKALRDARRWEKIFGFSDAVATLDRLCDKWIADDAKLHRADKQMLEEINQFLDGVASAPKETAYKQFKANVPQIEQSYRAMSGRLETLQLTSQLIRRV